MLGVLQINHFILEFELFITNRFTYKSFLYVPEFLSE